MLSFQLFQGQRSSSLYFSFGARCRCKRPNLCWFLVLRGSAHRQHVPFFHLTLPLLRPRGPETQRPKCISASATSSRLCSIVLLLPIPLPVPAIPAQTTAATALLLPAATARQRCTHRLLQPQQLLNN